MLIALRVLFLFADRGKHKSDSATKLVNKANSAAAKVTTSNGNGALNRYESAGVLLLSTGRDRILELPF